MTEKRFDKVLGSRRGRGLLAADEKPRVDLHPPPPQHMPRQPLDDRPDWLGRNGGWVLAVFGLGLVGVSIVVDKRQGLASVLAFSGVAVFVLGVLLSRLEGQFELGPTKFAATLKSVRKAGAREDLTLEEKADLMMRLLDIRTNDESMPIIAVESPEGKLSDTRAELGATFTDRPTLPRPLPFIVTGATDQVHQVGMAFENHVARTFEQDGWDVTQVGSVGDTGCDFTARKNGWLLCVQVKLRRQLGMADAQQLIARRYVRDDSQATAYVLAVNAGAMTSAARQLLATTEGLIFWEVPVDGW